MTTTMSGDAVLPGPPGSPDDPGRPAGGEVAGGPAGPPLEHPEVRPDSLLRRNANPATLDGVYPG